MRRGYIKDVKIHQKPDRLTLMVKLGVYRHTVTKTSSKKGKDMSKLFQNYHSVQLIPIARQLPGFN